MFHSNYLTKRNDATNVFIGLHSNIRSCDDMHLALCTLLSEMDRQIYASFYKVKQIKNI